MTLDEIAENDVYWCGEILVTERIVPTMKSYSSSKRALMMFSGIVVSVGGFLVCRYVRRETPLQCLFWFCSP